MAGDWPQDWDHLLGVEQISYCISNWDRLLWKLEEAGPSSFSQRQLGAWDQNIIFSFSWAFFFIFSNIMGASLHIVPRIVLSSLPLDPFFLCPWTTSLVLCTTPCCTHSRLRHQHLPWPVGPDYLEHGHTSGPHFSSEKAKKLDSYHATLEPQYSQNGYCGLRKESGCWKWEKREPNDLPGVLTKFPFTSRQEKGAWPVNLILL